jgi:DNA-directed RNA polymerase specialized sigma24 family protein
MRRLDEEQTQKIIQEYVDGATVYELSRQFGISRQTVSKILHRSGVPIRMTGLSPEQINEGVWLYEAGESLARIGGRLSVDAGTVHDRLRERGVRDAQGQERP